MALVSSTPARPMISLQVTVEVMSLTVEHSGNFLPLWTNATTALLFISRNCFRMPFCFPLRTNFWPEEQPELAVMPARLGMRMQGGKKRRELT